MWGKPVGAKKMRQNENPERRSDSIGVETALVSGNAKKAGGQA
jgi:hypothetical protein